MTMNMESPNVDDKLQAGVAGPEPSCLVVLMGGEWTDFFPGRMRDELEQVMPNVICMETSEVEGDGWEDVLHKVNPEVLLTGWSSPGLPKGFYGREGVRLKYHCHLTGNIRHKVRREDIAKGLVVTNWGNSISHTVAEHSLMMALALLRRVVHFSKVMHGDRRNTRDYKVRTLFGRRVGIHGFGQVARSLVPLLQHFRVRISAHSQGIPTGVMEEYGVEPVADLMDLFRDNEMVFELEGLSDQTRGSVTEDHLRAMPADGVFINCGRAEIVEEAGLLKVAQERRLTMGLDVFHTEPLPLDSPLRGLENVLLTPHVAGPMPEVRWFCGQYVLDNIRNWMDGKELSGVVSLAHYDSMS